VKLLVFRDFCRVIDQVQGKAQAAAHFLALRFTLWTIRARQVSWEFSWRPFSGFIRPTMSWSR
jgi:hypothetical protein